MTTRRALLLTATTGLLAGTISCPAVADPDSPDDPRSLINAIYTRVARGKATAAAGSSRQANRRGRETFRES
jgi:hypothetical protein